MAKKVLTKAGINQVTTDPSGRASRLSPTLFPKPQPTPSASAAASSGQKVTTTLLRQNAPLVARSTPAAAAASLALTSGVADQVKQEVARIPALPTPSAGRLTSAQDVTSAFSPRLMGHLFVIAGAANCVGQCITNPIDVVKTRMQMAGSTKFSPNLKYRGVYDAFRRTMTAEGIHGLWAGISPALMREVSYSGCRLGLYEPTKLLIQRAEGRSDSDCPFHVKVAAAAICSTIGSVIANPFTVVKIRMQMGGVVPGMVEHYTGTTRQAFRATLAGCGGWSGMWRGCAANTQRNAFATVCQIPTYDTTKKYMIKNHGATDGPGLQFFCCFVAGIVCSVVTSPIDLAKARIMASDTKRMSTVRCIYHVAQAEGLPAIYKGFTSQWLRLWPHCFITLMTFEQLRKATGMGYM